MYDNPLIYGKSDTTNIVAAHPVRNHSKAVMKYYRRVGDKITSKSEPWYPFALVHDSVILDGTSPRIKGYVLNGDGHYKYLAYVDNYEDFKELKEIINNANEKKKYSGFYISDMVQQWLIQTGNTMFKGMQFDDVLRLSVDIETYGENHFADAKNEDDPITIMTLADSRGRTEIFHWHATARIEGDTVFEDEEAMLRGFVSAIKTWDPDVLEAHNGFNYDWPYITTRMEMYGIKFDIGRDGSRAWSGYRSSFRAAEKNIDYTVFSVKGRHVVDTMFAAMSYDVFKRELPGYGLKKVAAYFGFEAEDRVYIEGDRIWWHWDNDPEPLLKYAIDDPVETSRIAGELMGSSFYTAPLIPMSYEEIARKGSGAKVESLFIREYLRRRESMPCPQRGRNVAGGHTRIHISGVIGPIVHADVESLYPSIMLNFDCVPASDSLGIFKELLQALTDLRFDWKGKMKRARNNKTRRKWEGMQAATKVLINSFYGYMGWPLGMWNDFDAAADITGHGRTIVKSMAQFIRDNGGQVVEVDTDGIYFVPPPELTTEEEERALVARMGEEQPEGINIGFDGRYQQMLSYKAKNYILETYPSEEDIAAGKTYGKRKFKGSSLRSRSMEKFGMEFISKGFDAILDGGLEELTRLYTEYRELIMTHEMPIEMLTKTTGLSKTIEEYLEDLSKPNVYRSSHYEVAMKLRDVYGEPVAKGDKIAYYISGTAQDIKNNAMFKLAKPIREYEKGDYNPTHYVARLDKVIEKFKPVFSGPDYRSIFYQQPSLFETDYDKIQTITKTH